ncbi:MAG: type II secretion system protein [Chlorobia bacterium]|nr:type II secretion system protein [Fimbriimonadaceae bacterium]
MPATSTPDQHDVAPAEYAFNRRLRAGFTLVEIAIVLVIIGGIMVGVEVIKVAENPIVDQSGNSV